MTIILHFLCTLKLQIHVFISRRLDYCNIRLAGASYSVLKEVQSIQNAVAHLVTNI